MQTIPDHIALNMKFMFVGYNPSIRSGETGHHYANTRNRFWTILEQSGITERRYSADEDQDLLDQGIGFTNIVPRPTRTAAEITAEEYAEGSRELKRKIELFRPERVCFVGKGVYEAFSGNRHATWGFQTVPVVSGVK
ncbi:mismatch-specific DNA-glycosylase, partial [Clostridium perfringens]|nr:mismatch-specific DNA-glycosylase [Clostridium perfringens]